jgi:NAD(P)-dependent dehydrogenase (short-subunit alcohol dehydrogenase family)
MSSEQSDMPSEHSVNRSRVAIVTGGSHGIGAVICQSLLTAGYPVISLDRDPSAIQAENLTPVQVDLTNSTQTYEVAEELARQHPATTIIHNAGAVLEKPLEDVALDDLHALTNLHLAAPLAVVQANLATMKTERFGRIVLVSTRAVLGLAKRTAYASTKAGLIAMARTWALELGPFGVTANVVAPGPIAGTRVFHDIIPADSPKIPGIVQAIPVKRLGTPEDVARAVLFFTAPEAGFVTGQTLYVCGGTSVGSIAF